MPDAVNALICIPLVRMQGDYILNGLLEGGCRQAGSNMVSENWDFGTEAVFDIEKLLGR